MQEAQDTIIKPKYRGVVHAIAFVCTACSSVVYAIAATLYRFDLGMLIYLISQLLQFGISSTYHIKAWPPRMRRIMQHIDHMCIFILISGTQTSVIMNIIDFSVFPIAKLLIRLSWTISAIGILKILIMNKLHNIFDLCVYIAHGLVVVPFYRIVFTCGLIDSTLIVLGALFYLIGGIVFGLERPDPFPLVFGYHEIFHVMTILANMCFAIIITRRYIMSLFEIKGF